MTPPWSPSPFGLPSCTRPLPPQLTRHSLSDVPAAVPAPVQGKEGALCPELLLGGWLCQAPQFSQGARLSLSQCDCYAPFVLEKQLAEPC